METTGQRFKKLRNELRLSQEAFAEKLGLSKSAISAVEGDKSFVSLKVLRTLFIDFNVNLNWLVTGVGNMFNARQLENIGDDVLDIVKKLVGEELDRRGIIR